MQETNPAELLRLYLAFDLLEEATHLALDYIDAVLGPQKQEFALQVLWMYVCMLCTRRLGTYWK